ncbi:hypothetical protein VA7868_03815 [Vibrio aerogenes CECT 7868]|uniref:NfeD-like C-terminal domain-containing protein n=1 Tax=Vibrio aerogenes CECT 7868 TaxID=1216006 RepID=A0A1M6BIS1_9VIBR|nr:hypothetical protein [Vibrio aerogenes]SHI48609.1 hypothetical protein VA7868_03815 [Vibrio aerogenes CECT 7868]
MLDIIFWIAIASTSIFVIKLLLMLFGADLSFDLGDDFLINSVLALAMTFCWSFLALSQDSGQITLGVYLKSLGISVSMSTAFMYLMRRAGKMETGVMTELSVEDGHPAEVYSRVPDKSASGYGKIKTTIEGKTYYLKAVSESRQFNSGETVSISRITHEIAHIDITKVN